MKNGIRNSSVVLAVILLALLAVGALVGASGPSQPILVTSAGQSPDDLIVKVMIDKLLAEPVERNALAGPEDLEGMQTLILAVGVSNKGLGAAGIDLDQEVARITSLLEAAREQECFIILLHIGGQARRGVGSDLVADLVAQFANSMIVVAAGNQDQFFNQLGEKYEASVLEVEARTDAANALAHMFE